jgi:hypothetical protein
MLERPPLWGTYLVFFTRSDFHFFKLNLQRKGKNI